MAMLVKLPMNALQLKHTVLLGPAAQLASHQYQLFLNKVFDGARGFLYFVMS